MSLGWQQPDGANAREILAFLDRLSAEPDASTLGDDAWFEWLSFRASVSSRRAMALASQGRWQEAALALQECRRLSGKLWAESAASLSARFSKSPSPDPPGKADTPAKIDAPARTDAPAKTNAPPRVLPPEVFLEVLRLPPVEQPLPPLPPPPLRFLVWGQPAWASRWEALRSTPSLAPWSAGELKWESPRDEDAARLIQAGFPASGWAVFQGDSTIITRGEAVPEVAILAMQLRSVAPSRIHLLDDFVAKHPEHLDARRDRLALVRARMPQAALESRLIEDAAKTFLPLDFGPDVPWITDLEGWRAQARKVVPELESVLQRWPDKAGLWRAWISWSAFLPKPPSVLAYAAGLPVFDAREAWTSQLPAEVHRAVIKECREARKVGPMADWFEGAWSSLVSQPPGMGLPQDAGREKAIYEGYRETLTLLGRRADLAELDRVWASRQAKAKAGPSS
jgi:hypothetical protein